MREAEIDWPIYRAISRMEKRRSGGGSVFRLPTCQIGLGRMARGENTEPRSANMPERDRFGCEVNKDGSEVVGRRHQIGPSVFIGLGAIRLSVTHGIYAPFGRVYRPT